MMRMIIKREYANPDECHHVCVVLNEIFVPGGDGYIGGIPAVMFCDDAAMIY